MAKNNKWMPTETEVYNEIRAFNERLRQARIKYGENSTIVKLMREKAQKGLGLKMTKTMGVSKSKKNVERVLQDNFSIYLFRRFIKENTVDTVIQPLIRPDVKATINKLPGKLRHQYLESEITSLKHFRDLYEKIYHDMYDAGYDKDEMDTIYILNTTKDYDDIVERYGNGIIDIDTYVDEMYDRRYGANRQIDDDDDDDEHIDYSDFVPGDPKE